jgi:hypothetical protein
MTLEPTDLPAALVEIERLRAWLREIAGETGTPYGRDAQAALAGAVLVPYEDVTPGWVEFPEPSAEAPSFAPAGRR